MTKEKKATMIADQCKPCTDDFYSGMYQGVLLTLKSTEDEINSLKRYSGLYEDTVIELEELKAQLSEHKDDVGTESVA